MMIFEKASLSAKSDFGNLHKAVSVQPKIGSTVQPDDFEGGRVQWYCN
jgi:hypothetical protein